jgi:hypothetical protein
VDGPRMNNPHVRADGSMVVHVPIKDILNPKIRRPPADDPMREEYDAGLRIVIHLAMIFSGVITVSILTIIGIEWYITVIANGLIPGAIQEVGDFKLHL